MAQNHLYRIQERQGKRDTYEVYKMTPDMDPVTVYVAVVNQWHEACDCPAWKACKHLKMVKRWIDLAPTDRERSVFDERKDMFVPNPLIVTEEEHDENVKFIDSKLNKNGDGI